MNERILELTRASLYHGKGIKGQGMTAIIFDNQDWHADRTKETIKIFAPEAEVKNLGYSMDELKEPYNHPPENTRINMSLKISSPYRFRVTDEYEKHGYIAYTGAGNDGRERRICSAGRRKAWISVGACMLRDGDVTWAYYSSYSHQEDLKSWENVEILGFAGVEMADGYVYHGTSCAGPVVTGLDLLYTQAFGHHSLDEYRNEIFPEHAVPIDTAEKRQGHGYFRLPDISDKSVMVVSDSFVGQEMSRLGVDEQEAKKRIKESIYYRDIVIFER